MPPRAQRNRSQRSVAPSGWRHRRRAWVLPLLVLAVVGGGAAAVWATGGAALPTALPAALAQAVRPSLGDANAPVVIVEYADFQCPFCGAFAREVQPQIEAAYVKTGKVRFEWRDFAWMGDESLAAANAARCAADQGAFWSYHDRLYAARVAPNSGTFSRERLLADAQALRLDTSSFTACLDGQNHRTEVAADTAEATRLGMTGTPTFLINGQRIVGAQPFDVFATTIEQALGAVGTP